MMSNERRNRSEGSADSDTLDALRTADHDRYLQVLLAASADRPALLALFHFNLELARIADHAGEPVAGLIRLQWWRDMLSTLGNDQPPASPTLASMASVGLAERLTPVVLLALVDARERELDATPLRRAEDVEGHARATAGALNRAAATLVGADEAAATAALNVGTAYGILGIVRAVPFVLRRAQPLLPKDLLAAHGTSAEALRSNPDAAALRPVVAELVERARALLGAVGKRQPRRLAAAFVPAVLARQDLARLDAREFDVFDGRLTERPPWTTARCLMAAWSGRFG